VKTLDQDFFDLLYVLEKESGLCRELLSILERERAILKTQNLAGLLENNKERETCLMRLRMCDESREAIIKKIAKTLNVANESLKLHTLLEWCPAALLEQMKRCIDMLTGLLLRIKTLNADNAQIVSFSLEHVQMCISMFENLGFLERTYQGSGQMKSVGWQRRLIDKEA
jgi:hypothetical protein